MTINRPRQTTSRTEEPQCTEIPSKPAKFSLTRTEFEQFLEVKLEEMFRRLERNLPAVEPFPTSLEELGFEITEEGKVVSTGKHGTAGTAAGRLFTFYNFYYEPANHMRKEAIHRAVRDTIFQEVGDLGLKELFLSGDGGCTITSEKPAGQHINILATEDLEELKNRRDIVIVIGEHTQDLAIWAWREIMSRRGLESGSAVGLARRLATSRLQMPKAAKQAERENEHEISMMRLEYGDAVPVDDNRFTTGTDKPPAIILLNPGRRLFSNDLNTNMTLVSWIYRVRAHILQRAYAIDETHNLVPGHEDPLSHIGTVFTKVLPQLLSPDADLYVVGISDSARDFARFMDSEVCTYSDVGLTEQVKAFAAIEPTFQPEDIHSDVTKAFLHHCARSWVGSEEPKGRFLSAPGAYDQMSCLSNSIPITLHNESVGDGNLAHIGDTQDQESIQFITHPEERKDLAEGDAIVSYDVAEAHEAADSIAVANSSPTDGVAEDPISPVTANSVSNAENDDHLNDTYYEYAKKPVLTPTFSAGSIGDVELVWPAVMDDVLLYFRGVALSHEKSRELI